MSPNETIHLDGLTRSCRRSVLVDQKVDDAFLLSREMVLDHGLLAFALGLRLATTTLVAELADTDVRAPAVNSSTNVVVLALRGTRVAGAPLAVGVPDHSRTAVLAPLRGRDDGLLAVQLGLADEDETAGTEVTGVADAIDFVLVVFGASTENELHTVYVDGAVERDVPLSLDFLFLAATGVEVDCAELVALAIATSPAVGQLVLGLERCDDGSDDLFFVCLDRNERQGCQLLVADDLHFSVLSVVKCADFEPQ